MILEAVGVERRAKPEVEVPVQAVLAGDVPACAHDRVEPPESVAIERAARVDAVAPLRAALDARPVAKAFFDTLKGANRYAVLYRIHDAKTAATRQARIDKFVAMLERHEVVHPPRPKAPPRP